LLQTPYLYKIENYGHWKPTGWPPVQAQSATISGSCQARTAAELGAVFDMDSSVRPTHGEQGKSVLTAITNAPAVTHRSCSIFEPSGSSLTVGNTNILFHIDMSR